MNNKINRGKQANENRKEIHNRKRKEVIPVQRLPNREEAR
jgi:hypothetical protein